MKKKYLKRSKPNEMEALEKMIRAHRADVAPYRLSYQPSFIRNQPILGRTYTHVITDDPYKPITLETLEACMRIINDPDMEAFVDYDVITESESEHHESPYLLPE